MKKELVKVLLWSIITFCIGCGSRSTIKFEEVDGNKKFKKENGEMAQSEWVTISGNDYYFDMNGYLQVDKWIDDNYYVDKDGKKLIKAWYTDSSTGKTYYLSSNGRYLKDTLATIDGKDYYFSSGGELIKDGVFKNSDGKYMYADEKGIINTSNNLVHVKDKTYFIDKFGIIYTGGWKEIGNDLYFFNSDGTMKKDEWHEATYYFGNDGKMLKNKKSPEGYEIDSDGKVIEKYRRELLAKDFKYLYQTYCKEPWSEVGEDGSYISIDTNPGNHDSSKYPYLSREHYEAAKSAIETLLKELGFPTYVRKKMGETSARDGRQSEILGDIEVSWTYHPDQGLEVIFAKK